MRSGGTRPNRGGQFVLAIGLWLAASPVAANAQLFGNAQEGSFTLRPPSAVAVLRLAVNDSVASTMLSFVIATVTVCDAVLLAEKCATSAVWSKSPASVLLFE